MDFQPDGEFGPKLTDWAKEPTILGLKADFMIAKPAHDAQVTKINGWNDLLHCKGKAAPPKVKGRSSVQPKLVRRQNEWRYSALTEPLLGTDRLFKISPTSWEDEAGARQNQTVLNWQFRSKLNRVKFVDDFVRSTVDDGTSVLRVGWQRTMVKVKQKVPTYTHYAIEDQQQLAQFQQALELRTADPKGFLQQVPANVQAALELYDQSGQATYAVQTGSETVTLDKAVENRPTVDVLDPRNFYLDPTCNGDVGKALFGIVSFDTNQAELKKNPERYKNLDKVNWSGSTPLAEPDHVTTVQDGQQFSDLLRKRVVAYEYWGFHDISGTGALEPIVCTWIGDTIIRLERNPFPDGKLPFVIVPYLPVKREIFGETDAELLGDSQAIIGALTRGMIDLLGRSANSQRGYAKGMLDVLNKRRYDNGEDYEFNPGINPQVGIVEHKYPELPQSALTMLSIQNQDAEALTGVKSFSGGISGESYGDVAAGIKGVLDAAAKREMAILRRLAQGLAEVGQKIIAMNAVFLSEQEVVRVTNAEFVQLGLPPAEGSSQDSKSGDWFVAVNREDLAGQFDLVVDISTAEVDNAKAQDMGFMLQTMGPNMDPGISREILADIADLKRMPALAHKIRTYQPQPDPIAEQIKQLELRKLQAEVQELETQAMLNQAKAREAAAKADRDDLDYVEQETGTKHARDLELQAGQARGNADLAITKALTAPKKEGEGKPDIAAAVGYSQLAAARDNVRPVDSGFGSADQPVQGPSLVPEFG